MNSSYAPIHELLVRVRSRWRRLLLFQAAVRAALAAAGVLGLLLLLMYSAASWAGRSPIVLALLGLGAIASAIGAVVWGMWPYRQVPSDRQVARYIEEQTGTLDERLVSAVDVETVTSLDARPALVTWLIADAARAASTVDPTSIVPGDHLRRAGFQAAAAALVLLAVVVGGRDRARQSFDAITLALFPSRVTLEVTPGNARVEAGHGLTVEAQLVGNRAPIIAQLLRAAGDADEWQAVEMRNAAAGRFTLALESLSTSFRYKVAAGALTSAVFEVAVVRAPRVTRVDVEYTYPKTFGLEPRVEQDGGDIYAPAGTTVHLRVHTDRPAARGQLMLAGGTPLDLTPDGSIALTGSLPVIEDGSYRVALADAEGMSSPGETEYFIRVLDDRPPEVHVTRPASDRRVTRLEEVEIEAEAQDDFGIERLDLVYAVRGGPEMVVPLTIPRRSTTVNGRHTLYLEDLDVAAGDFVSYYVRARDLPRGKRASETRSDIFFLEVKPFEQEFTLAQSQAVTGGGSGNRQIDDLVSAQKEIIVATWKLDRRSEAARGARSEQDIKSVSRAEAELKTRVEETSSSFRESNMRDPRRRPQATGRGGPPRAGQTMPEEDAMTAAAKAMASAVTSLDALQTAAALPPEMQALNHLLKAQADSKKRQVQRQQAAGGGGGNRATQDLSSLFDKELARHQQTNYETPTSTEQKDDQQANALDSIKELARRQDELLKRQQELARERAGMADEELKRELEALTRDQNELRQRADDLAGQMAGRQNSPADQGGQPKNQSGQQRQPGQQGGSAAPGQSGQGQSGSQNGRRMRDISEEMRSAASELRREDSAQASERAARALEKLRELERQMQSDTPDGRRRVLGDLQLEAGQLADAQRQIGSEAGRPRSGDAGKDVLRRLAGDQDRIAERLQRLQEGLKQQVAGAAGSSNRAGDGATEVARNREVRKVQQAAADASREIDRQRLTERMKQAAESMRSGAAPPGGDEAQQELARALDRLGNTLGSADGSGDDESRKLSGQLARAQELRQRLDRLNRELEQLGAAAQPEGQGNGQRPGLQQRGDGRSPGKDQSGTAQDGSPAAGNEVARLRDDLNRQMAQVQELMHQLQREDRTVTPGGGGRTFEGQGMTLSAPGTEAFKQDFAKWQELRRQATQSLDLAESTLAKKLQEKQAKDRLAAGIDDRAPAAYQSQVESYFKALATRKKP